ncbi:MAG: glycosyl hydrolase [Endomicrobia bacterium]|nr:glycosyl hydrolase [Endomicrobiia bacterium]
MKAIIKTAFFLSISLAAVTAAFAAPQKPSDAGVPWNLGNFMPSSNPNNRMPDPDLRMSAQPYAYPTNRWWGSAYITNPDFGAANPPYSTMMFLGPASIRFFNAQSSVVGVRLTAPNVATIPDSNGYGRVNGITSGTGFIQLSVSSNPVMDPTKPYTPYFINPSSLTVTNFSDWAVTAEIRDKANPDLKMTATFVKGGVFTYLKFSSGTYTDLRFGWQTWNYTVNDAANASGSIRWKNDGAIIRQNGQWFAIYLPANTSYSFPLYGDCYWGMRLIFPPDAETEEERYVIIAYLGNQTMYPTEADVLPLFLEYRKYAYNFITDTKVTWEKNDDSSITTKFQYATTVLPKRPSGDFVEGQTLFALYPHQWRYLAPGSPAVPLTVPGSSNPEYTTIRGKLKVYKGDSFKTRYEFHGILPSLTYEVPEANRSAFEDYIAADNNFSIAGAANDTYRKGKALAKAANLIPVFHQAGKIAERDLMKEKLKEELRLWYEGSGGRSFSYDAAWGGIIGAPGSYGSQLYSDHHFHYGYFVYASAILAMYDPEFASASQYKGMVDLLIRNFASPYRHNDIKFQERSFPFLRNFDVYAGQSWANGRGASAGDWGGGLDDGNDQESISEAMNAWAGIYLWGIMTNNTDWITLGMYGYTTESKAAEEYYFDIHNQTYPSDYSHRGGILFDNSLRYYTHWEYEGTVNPKATTKQERYGIWILPLTPSMLYMGYNPSAAQDYYNRMLNDTTAANDPSIWRDIFLRYKSLFNASEALTDWSSQPITAEEGSSLSYSYHFINFFNALGYVSTDYYALDEFNNPVAFTVMEKSNGEHTFIAYNNSDNEKKIKFFPRSGSSLPNNGEMTIPPKVLAQTKDFQSLKYDLIPSEITITPSTNTALNTYSIFSDNFLGAVIDGHIYNDPYNDALTLDLWKEGSITTVEITFSSSSASPEGMEGVNYLSAKRTYAGWGGWGFKFADGALDMSSFHDGKIEVSIKIDSASNVAEDFEIGLETAFGPVWFALGSLGFNQNSTDWQVISIPLSDQYITERSLRYVTTPFMMAHNAGSSSRSSNEWDIPVNISSVLWKKSESQLQLSAYFSAELKNRADNEPASVIGWTHSDFRQRYAVAQQYIEIGLNNSEGNSWCLQIYTDNTGDDLQYGGNISSDTVSGLVNISSANTAMIPIMWRVDHGIFDLNASSQTLVNDDGGSGLMVWGALRDVAAFSNTPGSLGYGSDEIIIWDRQGFKWDQWGMTRGVPIEDKKVRLYFLADFRNAIKGYSYKANIVIEYFNE